MPTIDDAIEKLNRGKYEEGMVILQRLREQDPDDLTVAYNLGMVYSDMGLIDKAIETLRPCAEKRGDANDHTALGVAYTRGGKTDEAINEFEAALKLDEHDFFALKNLGAVLGQVGQTDRSIEVFERALRINPNAAEVAYGLGRAYEVKGDLQRADEHYLKVLAIPGTSQARDLAKDGRTRIAHAGVKAQGTNMAAVFYLLDALEKYDSMSKEEVRQIAFDVALLGQRGLDINDPAKKYNVKSLPDTYSGLHMLCYMFVGFKIIEPTLDAGIDLNDEYQMALEMHEGKRG